MRAACEHGRYESHPNVKYENQDGFMRPVNDDYTKRCPGGREVTIDYEAAGKEIGAIVYGASRFRTKVTTKLQGHWAGRVVDAALKIRDN